MVIEHVENALDELQEARSAAGMGTALRLDSIINDLNRLREDTNQIHDDDN